MAGGMDLGQAGKGSKKPLDAAINLVPFIDLMAVTISFLIMTAVWTQLGRLQVSSSGQSGEAEEKEDDLQPITLLLTDKELRLTVGTVNYDPIPVTRNKEGQIDLAKLDERLKEIKGQPGNDKQAAITVQSEDAVKYEDLVRVIDECIGVGLPNVSVAAAMG